MHIIITLAEELDGARRVAHWPDHDFELHDSGALLVLTPKPADLDPKAEYTHGILAIYADGRWDEVTIGDAEKDRSPYEEQLEGGWVKPGDKPKVTINGPFPGATQDQPWGPPPYSGRAGG